MTEVDLAKFVQESGQWGLQLFGDSLDKTNGDFDAALQLAKRRYNLFSPPPSTNSLIMKQFEAQQAAMATGEPIVPDEQFEHEEEIMPEQQQQRPKPKHPKIKKSPFER